MNVWMDKIMAHMNRRKITLVCMDGINRQIDVRWMGGCCGCMDWTYGWIDGWDII